VIVSTCAEGIVTLDRRQFIRTSLDLTLLAAAVSAGVPADASASRGLPAVLTLFDGRFPAARKTALAWANGSPTRALGGDITDAVLELSALMHASTRCRVAGVTTEHVPFCLQQLARNPTRMHLSLQRLDSDLFVWTLTNQGRSV
jgi:hypothetical protein